MLGILETGVGLVGILVPEPGTTAAGVTVFALGANTVMDGFSQLAGANRGQGYNVFGEATGAIGAGIAQLSGGNRELGRTIGMGAFWVTSIAVGLMGSIRILKLPPGNIFLSRGVAKRPGGFTIGRVNLLYKNSRAKDGITILSINNNIDKSILRFMTHDGRLVVNGRIYGERKILNHEGNAREILKGLLKLLSHGAKQGW